MSQPTDLNVTLHALELNETAPQFPTDLSDSALMTLLKMSTWSSADEVFWMKSDSEIIYVNQSACDKLGYTREELVGMRVWEWDPLFPKEVWPTFWQELKEKKHIDFETQHQNKQGVIFPVRIKSQFFQQDDAEFLFAFVSDISQLKEQEAKLKRHSEALESQVKSRTDELALEREKFEHFVNLAPVGIAINRIHDGSFDYINTEFSRFTGYAIEELDNMDYWQLTPHEYAQQEISRSY